MSVGKKRRLERIFREDGKSVIVPMDHGVTLGPVKGLRNMQEIIDKLVLGGTDGIVLHKGIAKKNRNSWNGPYNALVSQYKSEFRSPMESSSLQCSACSNVRF